MSTSLSTITKGEREDLQRLIRQREKVLKSAAKQRSSELLADFENSLGAVFHYDNDATWAEATRIAKQEFKKANAKIAARSATLGVPKDFAPSLQFYWRERGDNAVKSRRDELRRMAMTRIAAIEAKAITEIELGCLEAQTQIASSGLTSETARTFLDTLPKIETLMPALSYEEVAGKADPPIVEQLTSPNALRQRRFRERHRNVTGQLHPTDPLHPEGAELLHPNALDGDSAGGDP